jgi:hypothetical protein
MLFLRREEEKILKEMNRKIIWLGLSTYLILSVLALVYYKERTIFADAAFHLFYILKDQESPIKSRFISSLIHAIPLWGAKFELTLESILKMYSLGFVVFHGSLFFIITALLKNDKLGLVLLLFNTLLITDSFYWIISEFPQGIALMLLFFALLSKFNAVNIFSNYWLFPLLSVLLVGIAYSHPLIIFPFFFIIAFFYLKKLFNKTLLKSVGLTFSLFYLINIYFFIPPSDNKKIAALSENVDLFYNYFDLASHENFIHYLLTDYYLWLAISIIVLIYYLVHKKIGLLFLVIISIVSYTLLINTTYPNGTQQFYIENFYLPLSLFVILPLVYDVLPSLRVRTAMCSLILLLILRITHISYSSTPFTYRLRWMRNEINKTSLSEHPKIIIPEHTVPLNVLMTTWGSAYEFWLLSTLENGRTCSIIISKNYSNLEWAIPEKRAFVTPWGIYQYTDLPNQYFIMKDSADYEVGYRYNGKLYLVTDVTQEND